MKHLTVRIEQGLYNSLKSKAEKMNTNPTNLIRSILQESLQKAEKKKEAVGAPDEKLNKVMLLMALQILGLTRFLVGRIDEKIVEDAKEKSEKIVEDFYGSSTAKVE